jgi:hypothetical protein
MTSERFPVVNQQKGAALYEKAGSTWRCVGMSDNWENGRHREKCRAVGKRYVETPLWGEFGKAVGTWVST